MKITTKLYPLILAFTLLCSSFKPKEITWTAIGDSITYLNDHLDETGNRVTKGYLTDVVDRLPNFHYINKGYNGWTIVGIAKNIDSLGIKKSDVYTVFLGTNDWGQGLPLGTLSDYQNNTGPGTSCGAYRVIINKLRALSPNARIILLTPLQRSDFVYIGDAHNNARGSYQPNKGRQLSQFADAIKAIGAYEHFTVIDLYNNSGITVANTVKFKRLKNPATGQYQDYKYPEYANIPFNPDSDKYPYPVEAVDNTYDGLHPSNKGNRMIAGMLAGVFMGMEK